MKKKIIIAVAVIVILAAGGTFYLNHKVSSAVKDGKIIKGVSCEGISIGGMTRSEANDAIESHMKEIHQEKITADNIYHLLLAFDEVYNAATEVEQKEFMRAFIEHIDIFPEKQPDGNWIRNIVFAFPVPYNGKEIREFPLESQSTVECVLLMSKAQ